MNDCSDCVTINIKLVKLFLKRVKKDHGGMFGIEDHNQFKISNDGNLITFSGSYDCPPIFFKYIYGGSTGWKLKDGYEEDQKLKGS